MERPADSTPALLIQGGTVVTDRGAARADILVRGERVVEVAANLDASRADVVIDATNDLVLPGAIDLHVHFEEPGPFQREGYLTGTRAAAAGGITMVVEHPLSEPPTTTADRYIQKRGQVEPSAHVDFGLWGGAVPGNLAELEGMSMAGAPGFKAFMVGSEPEYPPLLGDALSEVMEKVASLGSILVVHAEDQEMTSEAAARIRSTGRMDALAWAESRSPESEQVAVREALRRAGLSGCRVHLAHLSTAASVEAVVAARASGGVVLAETCPHFLLLNEDDLAREGVWAKTAPPLRSERERSRLWEVLVAGGVDVIASDHAPWEPKEKQPSSGSIWDVPNGLQSLQLMTVLMLDAWTDRGLPLEDWVRLSSVAPARWLGLYPRKGTIKPGSDADIAIYRKREPRAILASELLDRHQWTPYEGMTTRYSLRTTILRGAVVFDDGAIIGEPRGRFVAMGGATQ